MTDEMTDKLPAKAFGRVIKVLLVDDVELFLDLEKTFFRRDEVDLLVACNGEEALELIVKEHPDVVFLDLYMPGINGDEVCRRVKKNAQTENVPIVMVIQPGSIEDEQICQQAGCDDILYKPVRKESFIFAARRNMLIAERVHPRVDASIKVNFGLQPKKYLEHYSINISESGVFIATGSILAEGTRLNIQLQLPGSSNDISCAGVVAWVNHPDWMKKPKLPVGMGIEFIDPKSEHLELLHLFVDCQRLYSA